jgi:ATP-dependent DNA helicase RecG
MRPEILFPIFRPTTSLPGVGPRVAQTLEKAAGARAIDLIWHLPTGLIDRRYTPTVAEARPGAVATLTVEITEHRPPHNPRQPYRIAAKDESGSISLVFFHARADYLKRLLPAGEVRVISGTVETYGAERQMTHPDRIATLAEIDSLRVVEPVYPLVAGLSLKVFGKILKTVIQNLPDLPEWSDPAFFKQRKWPVWKEAVTSVHSPEGDADLDASAPARQRLIYDELLANQLALLLIRAGTRRTPGRAIAGDGTLQGKALASLAFQLTEDQQKALADIQRDMASPSRMLRLLQGDVGSGKTVVAALAMLTAVESGTQAVLMAPTEVLVRQHQKTMAPITQAAGVKMVVLTGREKGRARSEALAALADGSAAIVLGTHALFQEDVKFENLALTVIDEQHKFGVQQRLSLAAKGNRPDVLVMTATPIPRTLMLTAYGDMDETRILHKPIGRQPVDTRAIPLTRLGDVTGAVKRAISAGERVFWVCPLVSESEAIDVAAAEERWRHLQAILPPDQVHLVHGQMTATAKDQAMDSFANGPPGVLVATTVIEVGIDVPDATVMVIEHAERFGLAQLHQLRGRVGRGSVASTCLLLYEPPLGETARARLNIMRDSDDGFRIAEEDLRLRGAGEVLGTRQSGLPVFRLADIARDSDLLAIARDDARLAIDRDPDLSSERGKAMRVLLYLFERDQAVRYLRSG